MEFQFLFGSDLVFEDSSIRATSDCQQQTLSLLPSLTRIQMKLEDCFSAEAEGYDAYLHHTSARVEEDAPFGLFGDLLVSVEVHDVGVIWQLGELEIPPLERLHRQSKKMH